MVKVKFDNKTELSYSMKESLRALRTNIKFCGDDIKTILITSTIPNEGKSTVTMNLARSLTETGKNVLVIDTDMRKSVLVGRLRAKAENGEVLGLSHYLSGQNKLEELLYETEYPRLYMIFAGPAVSNPTEIIEKKYFPKLLEACKQSFDYILLDCAPLGAAIDAAVIAKKCDGAIVVVGQGAASSRAVASTVKQLKAANVKILGAVLNKVKVKKSGYGSYYGSHYGSYYGSYYGNYYKNEAEMDEIEERESTVKGITIEE